MPEPERLRKKWLKRIWHRLQHQSLTVKLVGMMSLVICLIVIVGTLLVINITKKAIAETSVTQALYRTQLIKSGLTAMMFSNEKIRHRQMNDFLVREKSVHQLGDINILNPEGVIRFSSSKKNIGKVESLLVDREDRFTSDDALVEFSNLNETGTLRIVHPVRGNAQCALCHHNQAGQLLGMMELFVPVGPIYKRFATNRFFFMFAALAIIAVGAFFTRWMIHRMVRDPIQKLIRVMEKAEKGELDVRTRIHEDPDLDRLAQSFNAMVRGIEAVQKRVEEQYQRELAQSNRLASLGQFISNISHEVKNPLAAIRSALHALRGEFKTVDGKEIYRELSLQIERIGQTVNNLLRYARKAPPRFESCVILEPIQKALRLAQHLLLRNQIQTQMDCFAQQATIKGDSNELEQVFLNLFLNAAAAMPSGGTLTIRIRPAAAFDRLSIEICDTGLGIHPEYLPKLFEPFFTTKKDGTGLGLTVVKGIVESHGGEISIQSILGQGTSVLIGFPLVEKLETQEIFSGAAL